MNQGPIILEGVTLMLLGMGFVFCFLALLVGATRLLSSISMKLAPPVVKPARASSNIPSHTKSDDSVVAAISAALHHHKKKMSQQV